MAIAPLQPSNIAIDNSFDFSPLVTLGQQLAPKDNSLAAVADRAAPTVWQGGAQPVPYTGNAGGGGPNVQSWYDFTTRPVDQGGLGLSHAQAVGQIGNLQAESGSAIPSWGPTGDQGSAHGAAQWRLDRFNNLQKFAADRGLDYRSTEAQQAFMRHEYLGSERAAYDRLTAAQTPQQAASVVNRYYERSADASGRREANALRLFKQLGNQDGN
jgi:hypothetical protein